LVDSLMLATTVEKKIQYSNQHAWLISIQISKWKGFRRLQKRGNFLLSLNYIVLWKARKECSFLPFFMFFVHFFIYGERIIRCIAFGFRWSWSYLKAFCCLRTKQIFYKLKYLKKGTSIFLSRLHLKFSNDYRNNYSIIENSIFPMNENF